MPKMTKAEARAATDLRCAVRKLTPLFRRRKASELAALLEYAVGAVTAVHEHYEKPDAYGYPSAKLCKDVGDMAALSRLVTTS